MDTKLIDTRQQLDSGLITKTGYVMACIALLELDTPMALPRAWLADQLGLSPTATTKLLHKLKKQSLII
jgi:DNA-binding MarR family transcriptional regulator